jgi:methylmalonyl-CoA/ethylmalonyl-CoA epimerase
MASHVNDYPAYEGAAVTGAGRIYLDHLAIGTERWADGYPVLAQRLGGRWSHGGNAGEFASGQLAYHDGMHLEVISPGSAGPGFMRRFLDRSGPGPHHITFHVPSLDTALADVAALGVTTFDGLVAPFRREAFLHPKKAGVGTLIQLVEEDHELVLGLTAGPPPEGFPVDLPDPADIAWIGLTADSVDFAEALFAEALEGDVAEAGQGWRLFSWGPQRRLLVRQSPAEPGAAQLWTVPAGVAHLAIGPADASPGRLDDVQPQDYDPRVGLRVWSVRSSAARPGQHPQGGDHS